MAQKIIPVGQKLLIKEIKAATKTASGLIIPTIAQKITYEGKVVGKGESIHEIEIGDVVRYAEHAMPTPMKHEGEEHLLLQLGDVYAIIRDE